MKIVLLDGGLANQMTQYIFARCLQEETKDMVFLDDLYFFSHPQSEIALSDEIVENHRFQLDKFPNIKKVPRLSEFFEKDVWEEFICISKAKGDVYGSWTPQILKDNGLDFFMIAETYLPKFDGMIAYMPYYYCMPEMLAAQGNVYYYGWFTNGGWFMRHEQMFRHEFQFPPFYDEIDVALAEKIKNSFSLGVHVRCSGGYKSQGIAATPEYYKNTLEEVIKVLTLKRPEVLDRLHLFVFSDDIAYCKENMKTLGLSDLPYPVTFGQEKRTIENNQNDMVLMSMCDGLILNNSVYGYMAALLNSNPNKMIINPVKGRGIF